MTAVACCGAAGRFVGSASPRAAAPGSLAAVLCPGALRPPHAPGAGGGCGGRAAGPAGWGVASGCAGADAWRPSCGGRVCGRLHRVRGVRLQLGGSLGPRAWSARRRGRAVTCARGGVALRAACGCAAATYGDLRPGSCCASGA